MIDRFRDATATAQGAERRSGRVVTIAVWAVTVPFAAWSLVRSAGWQPGFRWVQLVAFTPYIAVGAVVVALAALALRRWWPAAVAVVAAGLLLGAVLPRALPDGNPRATGPTVRILTANLLAGAAPAPAVVDLVRGLRVDVLTLQELTPGAAARLDAAGLRELLPQRSPFPQNGVGGSGVYARFPVHASRPAIEIGGFGQVQASVEVPGAPPVEVVSVHPCAPSHAASAGCWTAGLEALPGTDRTGPLRILAGDFNATLDHPQIRRLLSAGYRDAADVTGDGLSTTWPYSGDLTAFTPPVTIDHVLADRRIAVRGFSVHGLPVTDHHATFAQLTLPIAAD